MKPTSRNRRVRILYLLDQLYSARGGSEQHLYWLLQTLPEDQFEKHFVVLSKTHSDTSTWPLSAVLMSAKHGCGPSAWHRRLLAVARFIRDRKIDIVHTFCPMSESVALFTRAIGCRARVIGNRRNTGYALTRFRAARSRAMQVFDVAYLANSQVAKAHAVAKEKILPNRISVIPNPVCERRITAGIRNLRPRSDLAADDASIVAMVATVRPVKDYDTFLRAARIVTDRFPHVRFVAIGEQEQGLAELKKLTENLKLADRFLWYGGIDNPFSLLPHVDVAVLSSRSESFSNAVLEYAAAGLPSVVTDVGALAEIVLDGQTGYVVPPASPVALAKGILRLLQDPTLQRKLGEAAKCHVLEHYTESVILDAYMSTYHRLVKSLF